ncbi:deaminase [Plantactinospora sp. KBS50]|uniref:deoxycytidylate deaminase n=1 Tax=Plantactinospora sp. KBS50 TaxID=2024580 RepID=UPI000BAAAB09|nr:deaminase [Plantactinospora sp. KBS50]ASW57098.1 deoxycytidylate deaminase [Plantactinospora sp. KBS50]
MKQLLLYLPVLHAGYEAFLDRHGDAAEILLLGAGFAADHPALRKDIRALAPETAARYLSAAGGRPPVRVVPPDGLCAAVRADVLVVPDEELLRDLVSRHGLAEGRTVRYERTFLRWDRPWSQAQRPAGYDGRVAVDELSVRLTRRAAEAAAHSSDWWRQVGAVAARDGEILDVAYNRHLPTEYAPYLDGDPRNEFRRGVRADLSTAIHAEALLVARAARTGVALAGADLYVSTFPCPACARLVAEAGFRSCHFAGPYALLDGDGILRSAGVELIWVDLGDPLA